VKIQAYHIASDTTYEAVATFVNHGTHRHDVLEVEERYHPGNILYKAREEMSWYPLATDVWTLLWEVEL